MNTLKDKFSFLFATRFWALVIGAVIFYLKTKGWVGEAEMILTNTILGGFIITKTIDRNLGDKPVEVAKINTGMSPEEAKTVL